MPAPPPGKTPTRGDVLPLIGVEPFPDAISEGFLSSYWSLDFIDFVAVRPPSGYRPAPGAGFPERVLSSKMQSEVIIHYHLHHF